MGVSHARERDGDGALARLEHLAVVGVVHLRAPELADRAQAQARRRPAPRAGPRRGRVPDDRERLRGGVELGERVAQPGGLRSRPGAR